MTLICRATSHLGEMHRQGPQARVWHQGYNPHTTSPRRSHKSSFLYNSDDSGECYVCWGIGHLAKDCPFQEEAYRYARRLREKNENSGHSRAQKLKSNFRNGSKRNPSRQNSVSKSVMFEKKPTLSTKTRYYSSSKNKAFIAGTESESQSDTSTDSEESFTVKGLTPKQM